MNHNTQPNTPEVHAVFRDRDERTLSGSNRLPTIMAMASDAEHAKEALLVLSGLSEDAISDFDLRDPQLDPIELCNLLEEITGDRFDVYPYELEPRFFGPQNA